MAFIFLGEFIVFTVLSFHSQVK